MRRRAAAPARAGLATGARVPAVVAVVLAATILVVLSLAVALVPSPGEGRTDPGGVSGSAVPAHGGTAGGGTADGGDRAAPAPGDVLALLRRRDRAEATGDRAAWAATVLHPDGPRGREEVAALRRMRAMAVTGLRHTGVGGVRPVPGTPGRAVAVAAGRYALGGIDRAPRRFTRPVLLGRDGAGWRVVGRARPAEVEAAGVPSGTLEPWDLTGARVLRSPPAAEGDDVGNDGSGNGGDGGSGGGGRDAAPPAVVVVGDAPGDEDRVLRGLLADARSAARTAAGVCGAPRPGMAVLLPGDLGELTALVGAPVDPRQVAAVTVGPRPPGRVSTSDRVVVSGSALDRLTPEGRRVVLAHEATHLALRAAVAGIPATWLAEGLADVVGYAGSGLAPARVAADELARVRADGPPRHLPGPGAFDAASGPVGPAYQAAYLAVRLLRREHGPAAVCRLYRAAAESVAAGVPPAQATREAFPGATGVTEAAFTRAWARHVQRLARG